MEHWLFYRVLHHPLLFLKFVSIRSRVKTGSSSQLQESSHMIPSSRATTDGKFPSFWSDKGLKSVLETGWETSFPFASKTDYTILNQTIVHWLASQVAQMVKNPPTMQKTQVQSLGQEDPLEKELATHFSILAWRIPWTGEPGQLQSMGSQESDTSWRLNNNCVLTEILMFVFDFLCDCSQWEWMGREAYAKNSEFSRLELCSNVMVLSVMWTKQKFLTSFYSCFFPWILNWPKDLGEKNVHSASIWCFSRSINTSGSTDYIFICLKCMKLQHTVRRKHLLFLLTETFHS